MKNKLKYIPLGISAFLVMGFGMNAASAKSFDMNEIDKISGVEIGGEVVYDNVYIIGNHLFTNVITLDDIMTASRTIEDGKPNIIYHRSTEKVWSNSLSNEEITAPENFEIKVANKESVEDAVLAARLAELKEQAKGYKESEYTVKTLENITNALALEESTDELKTVKVAALEQAYTEARFANLDELENLVKEVEGYVSTDYTEASYTAFINSYNGVKDMEINTYTLINNKISVIKNLQKLLVKESVDASSLTTAINDEYTDGASRTTLKLTEANYTVESWANYNTALENAKTAEAKDIQSVIDNAKKAIEDTKKALVFANLEELQTLKDEVFESDTYTVDSYKALTDALALAETTFAEIDTKITAIEAAINNLVTKQADEDLKASIDLAKTYVESEYSAESYKALTDALALTPTTNKDHLDKIVAINDAISKLKFADSKKLEDELKLHEALVEENYTKDSWSMYLTLKEAAVNKEVTNNADVLLKIKALEKARELLTKVDNKLSELTTTINGEYSDGETRTTLKLTEANYTVESWNAYKKAITDAIELEKNQDAFVSEVKMANDKIVETKSALVFANLKTLNDLIIAKKELVKEEYTEESFALLEAALNVEDKTTFDKIATAIQAINDVELVFANKAALTALVTETNKLTSATYTDESYAKVTEALAKEETTFALINSKIEAINKAVAGLITKVNATELQTVKDSLTDTTETHYTTESWDNYKLALNKPYTNETELIANIADLKSAIKGLEFANLKTLNDLITAKKALVKEEYTEDSYTLLETAINVENKTTFDKIATAITAINDVQLVFANKAVLDKTVNDAKALVKGQYTEASYTFLTEALALPETTFALINSKSEAIKTAVEGLVFTNLENLQTLIDSLKDLNKDEYTTITYEALQTSINTKATTYSEIDAKITDINAKKTALVFSNLATLNNLVANKGLVQNQYTEASYTIYQTVVTENAYVLNDTYAIINEKIANINNAKKTLVFANLKTLTDLKNQLSNIVATDYTEASYNIYQEEYNLALLNPETTYELIAIKIDSLTAAQAKLVAKELVLTSLDEAIKAEYNGNELIIKNDDSTYTTESYTAYTTALTNASNAMKNQEGLLQSNVDKLISELQTAKAGLTLVEKDA